MEPCPSRAKRFRGEEGSNLVEYALLVSLILLVCVSAASFFAESNNTKMSTSASAITNAS